MSAKRSHYTGAVVLGTLVALMLTAGIVLATSWIPAEDLSKTASLPRTNWVDIATAEDDVVVVWANRQAAAGVTIVRKQGANANWGTPIKPGTTPQSLPQYVWAPTIAHSGSHITAVWAEGAQTGSCAGPHRIVSYNLGSTAKTVVIDRIYSPMTAPHITVGDTGWHMVFVASATKETCNSEANLYYSYRASAADIWSVPKVIVTHNQVVPDALAGDISYPKIATVDGTTSVHVVWEQFRFGQGAVIDTSVWLLSGTTVNKKTEWSTPTQLSPVEQTNAVRPSITSGAGGKAHIAWTSRTGGGVDQFEQFIYYLSFPDRIVRQPYSQAIKVTSDFPDYASSSIVAVGNKICITWYGYFGTHGTDYDEIILGCSKDGGLSWQEVTNVSGSAANRWFSIFPVTSMEPSGKMHFAWTEYNWSGSDYDPLSVYYRANSEGTDSPTVFLPLVVRGR